MTDDLEERLRRYGDALDTAITEREVSARRVRDRRSVRAGLVAAADDVVLGGVMLLAGHRDQASLHTGASPTITDSHLTTLAPTTTESPQDPRHVPPVGTITGTLVMSGGPGPGVHIDVPGRVTAASVTDKSGSVTVTAGPDGRFTLVLPPGAYSLTGASPRYGNWNGECRGGWLIVRAGSTIHRDVVCEMM
jgi:hypothetical protein